MPSTHETGDGSPHIRWHLVGALGGLGLAFVVAAKFTDHYARDLFLGLGVSLGLSAVIFYFEQRVVAVVEQASGPQTLEEAQRQLAGVVGRARARGEGLRSAANVEDALAASLARAKKQLADAGLKEQPPGGDAGVVTFEDEAGMSIRWTIAWDERGPRHEVSYRSATWSTADPRQLSSGPVTDADQRTLDTFEAEVFTLLKELVLMIAGRR